MNVIEEDPFRGGDDDEEDKKIHETFRDIFNENI